MDIYAINYKWKDIISRMTWESVFNTDSLEGKCIETIMKSSVFTHYVDEIKETMGGCANEFTWYIHSEDNFETCKIFCVIAWFDTEMHIATCLFQTMRRGYISRLHFEDEIYNKTADGFQLEKAEIMPVKTKDKPIR